MGIKDGKHFYLTSYEIIKYDDCYIQLIKNVSCNNKEELTSVEYDVIQETENSVNKANPKCKAPDYSNAKIYKIVSDKTDKVYIGSSIQELCKRFNSHMCEYRKWKNGKYHYVTSFEILQYGDARIELIEEYECKTEEDLLKREGEIMKEYDNRVNKVIAGRTREQWREANKEKIAERVKEYREANKERIAQYQKEHYEANKERIAQYQKEYDEARKEKRKQKYTCICGSVLQSGAKARHEKTIKHKNYIESNPTN